MSGRRTVPVALLALWVSGCASAPGPGPGPGLGWNPEQRVQRDTACAWEARFRDRAGGPEARHAACVEGIGSGSATGVWRPGAGSSAADLGECLDLAHAAVVRFRGCMERDDWRELEDARVPYTHPGRDAKQANLATRGCAERSFEGSRYGPFSIEFAQCLARRGWRHAP